MAKSTCFNCGEETNSVVNRSQPPALARRVCTSAACWKAWWAACEATPPNSKRKGK